MIKRQSVVHAALAIAAAMCTYVSSAGAVTNRWLDTNPGTPNLNYYPNVTDSSGADFATANMFVGNWFGWEGALLDVVNVYSGATQSRYQIVVQCSPGGNYGTPGIVTLPNMSPGAEGAVPCPWPGIATQSTQAILYQ
jgi:hypothetical protein